MVETILEAEDIEYTYTDGTKALRKVNMVVRCGEKIAVLGSNGAGKSTLFLHFNAILQPERGCIRFHGRKLSYKKDEIMELRRKIGIVFQDPDNQLFSASVLQEVSFGPMNLGLSEAEVRNCVEKALRATEISDLIDRPTHILSFGQKKRVSIADILAMEPEVIIFDEPTAWLDPRHAREFMQLLDELSQQGKTIIISTHDVDLAYSWADRIFVMKQGQVLTDGKPEEVFCQQEVISSADLNRPWLVETHDEFIRLGLLPSSTCLPRNKEELYESLARPCYNVFRHF
ncbi:energy-coupling factor ABC transporter ATP-binding protein [Desulfitobacterium metallireducens]|uniref:ABC transporter ATP-binding protein n=1 Tax=Desulfitobacterium metallireducens DSM 15288 TaxID=871968 RepID=W0E749_9FIRM|nr:ATP-binding cassette domain-containing protein [Desulfitobacterium metallireducens]AHF06602.1 cobalt ABC transporter ATPase [Desulfitobacterium metallireducens DSM 15288]